MEANKALETKKRAQNTAEQEIDLIALFYEIRERIWAVLLVTILAADIAFAITYFLITPMYSSTATMLVLTKETTLSSLADLQMGSQLTNDYEILIKTDTVMLGVIEELGLDMNKTQLANVISITNPNDSRVLKITAQDPSPERAAEIVNTVAAQASVYIADMMEVTPPKIAEKGIVPTRRTSPSYSRNVMMGALIGFILSAGLITLAYIMNDSIQTEEDIERYLNLPVLASVPEKETSKKKNKNKGRRKKETEV